jgi:hypothetical protein
MQWKGTEENGREWNGMECKGTEQNAVPSATKALSAPLGSSGPPRLGGGVETDGSRQDCSRFRHVNVMYIKNAVFWDVTLCDSCKNGRFGGTQHLFLTLNFFAACVGC